jgi:hypothetical protein
MSTCSREARFVWRLIAVGLMLSAVFTDVLTLHTLRGGGGGGGGDPGSRVLAGRLPTGAALAAASASDGSGSSKEGPAVAGFYIYFEHVKAVVHAVQAFRAAYPTSTLVMHCDNGCFNLTHLARAVNATHGDGPKSIARKGVGGMYLGRAEAERYALLMRDAVNLMPEPFFVLLEDDVFVMKRIRSELAFDINGWAPDKRIKEHAEDYVRSRNPMAPFEIPLSGFGGSVYRTDFFRRVLNSPTLGAELDALFGLVGLEDGKPVEESKRPKLFYGPDYVFGSLAVAHMGTLGTFCGYVESFEERAVLMRQEGMVEVLHGFKDLYSENPSAEEEALLGPVWRSRLQL